MYHEYVTVFKLAMHKTACVVLTHSVHYLVYENVHPSVSQCICETDFISRVCVCFSPSAAMGSVQVSKKSIMPAATQRRGLGHFSNTQTRNRFSHLQCNRIKCT